MTIQAEPPPPPPPPPPNAPARPLRGPEFWRRSFCYITGLGMTPEDRAQFERDSASRKQDTECRKCEKHRDYLMKYSPTIRFMLSNIKQVNGDMNADNIRCMPCDTLQSGGFSPQYGILLCQNQLRGRGHVEDTLAHELVHVYDQLRFEVDWDDLKHHACSEIRASSLSGECRWTREAFTRGVWDFTQQHQACVRRRATLSVRGNPKCKDDVEAAKIVNMVFDSCFADTRPFTDIYR